MISPRTARPFARTIAAAVALALAAPALAHDFWIELARYHATVGDPVNVTLYIGHSGQADEGARNAEHIEAFTITGPDGKATPVVGFPGRSPAGIIRPESPGLHIVGYRSTRKFIEMKPAKFEGYLLEEGLERIVEQRKSRGETDAPGLELYSRSCKTLLNVAGEEGEPSAVGRAAADRRIGLTLEFVAGANPADLEAGDVLPLTLYYNGKPLANARVDAEQYTPKAAGQTDAEHEHDHETTRLNARTDRAGRVAFTLPRSGVWIITTTHMIEAPADSEADWESIWGALTIEVPSE